MGYQLSAISRSLFALRDSPFATGFSLAEGTWRSRTPSTVCSNHGLPRIARKKRFPLRKSAADHKLNEPSFGEERLPQDCTALCRVNQSLVTVNLRAREARTAIFFDSQW